MGEKGLSGTAGDETFEDDGYEAPSEPSAAEPETHDDRARQPEREPAFASGDATPEPDDVPGVAYGG